MFNKNNVERLDIVSRKKYKRKDLIRISYSKETGLFNKIDSYANNKGIYIKKDKETVDLLKKRKILNRLIKKDISDDFYEELYNIVENK